MTKEEYENLTFPCYAYINAEPKNIDDTHFEIIEPFKKLIGCRVTLVSKNTREISLQWCVYSPSPEDCKRLHLFDNAQCGGPYTMFTLGLEKKLEGDRL